MGWRNIFKPQTFAANARQAWRGATGESTKDRERRENLNNQGGMSSWFADRGQENFGQLGQEAQAQRDELRARASGKGMMSTEMLRQGLQQQLGQQRSMAAGAAPQNQAMAARTAANNMGRASYGMSGQATMAGLQEQKDASAQLSNMINAGRDQEQGVALGSRGNAIQAYGGGDKEKDKSGIEKYGPAIASVAGMLMSDERAKKGARDGSDKASRIVGALKAQKFKYKDEANGEGEQLGVMAQGLEKAGLKHTVVETPKGKMVDGAKLSAANTALLASLGERISKLEKRK